MKKAIVCLLALIFIFSQSDLIFAQPADPNLQLTETSPSCGVCEGAESQNFGKSAPGKIGRGVINILLGWTNLFAQPIQAGQSGGSVLSGIGNGFVYTFTRTVQGVVELGLFWLPPSHGEPLTHCALGDLGVTGR
jgi:putative exosortase-associated protein (TIGR04073 family)